MDGVADFPVAAGESAATGQGTEIPFGGDDLVYPLEEGAVGIEWHGQIPRFGKPSECVEKKGTPVHDIKVPFIIYVARYGWLVGGFGRVAHHSHGC